jgi:putative ABC transport system substrate-binding protein
MDRRRFLLTSLAGVLAAPLVAEGQQTGKVYRIGVLVVSSASEYRRNVDAFREGLRELGYVEGHNAVLEYKWAEGRYDRLSHLVVELVRSMATVGDPVEQGLVASLARPGGNITGLSQLFSELVAKRVELLKELVPGITRVAVLMNPLNPSHRPQMFRQVEAVAVSLGVELYQFPITMAEDLEPAFAGMAKRRVQGVLVVEDGLINSHSTRIVELANRNKLPSAGFKPIAEAGGLMAYAPDHRDLWRRAATYVDKILKGAKPGDLPVEQPTKFELVINRKTAKALGLTIPASLLARADQVIE